MKNFKRYIFVVVSLFCSTSLFSQAFEKGNWNIDLDLGYGAYGTQTTSKITLGVLSQTDINYDGTASSIVRLGGEYGVSNKIGLGIKIGHSNYFIAPEDRDTVKSVTSNDFAIDVNFHLLKANRNDLFLTLGLGVTAADWQYQNNPLVLLSSAKGTGSYVNVGITDRIFFSEHIGLLFNLSYAGYNYKVTPELSSVAKSFIGNLSYTWDLNILLKGVNLGTGLAVKF